MWEESGMRNSIQEREDVYLYYCLPFHAIHCIPHSTSANGDLNLLASIVLEWYFQEAE